MSDSSAAPVRIGHVMILASAGSGKTYALTNRYVRLLALGAAPERIVALTFTRKAAGEFFEEILRKLARAAGDPTFAAKLTEELGLIPQPPQYEQLLRRVVDALHRLRLGTLDGFFGRIVRTFAIELGLTGDFEVLQEHSARVQRARVLRRMFERTGDLAAAQREFIEAFKRATFGVEEKRLSAQLDAFLDRHQEVFLAAPLADCWGNPQRIWEEGLRWRQPTEAELSAAVKTLRQWSGEATLADKQRQRWLDFIDAWETWAPGTVPSRPLAYVLEKALASWDALAAGNAVLEFDRKKQELSGEACSALAVLTQRVVAGEIERRLEMTRGMHAVLAGYEAVYHDAVRRAGKLTFADVQRLLQPDCGAPMLSSGGNDVFDAVDTRHDDRLLIDYRLDGEIDHWLLDEFQDTSFGQWSILRNLVDEVVQDPSGARSFFYVGDVKQAIFAWREGDPRLFREIFDHYNAIAPGSIEERHLVDSWRSGPAIIAAVNRVFGAAPVLTELFPGPAARDWNREWLAHRSAKPELDGHVALLHGVDELDRFAITLRLLQEIEPLERGLSCAVLVQDNRTAAALADFLRHEGGVPAIAEADLHVCTDNPLGAALLALVQAAAHPGDTLAWEHVQMTPLRDLLVLEELNSPEAVTLRVLDQIHRLGFEGTLRYWAERLLANVPADDVFTRERARQIVAAAELFDLTGTREVAEFIAFMERHTVRDAEASAVVRVMTIHKSKGLGFDVVILPDVEGQRLDCRRDGLAVQRAADRTIEWVLDLPGKLFHACDEVLSAHVRAAEADACYEAISLLYVAMTRAKRAMYLVMKPPGTSVSRNYPRLLATTLGEEEQTIAVGGQEFRGAYAEGNAKWFETLRAEAKPAVETSDDVPLLADGTPAQPRLPARRASAGKLAEMSGAQLFSLQGGAAASFGTAVHALLAEVEWLADARAAHGFAERWRAQAEDPAGVEEALACLLDPQLAPVWTSLANAEVWRERAFEIVLDGAWITGVFDRVVVQREKGRAVAATVFDFKTDRLASAEDRANAVRRHAPQLRIYRRAVAVLAGIPLAHVRGELVFTRTRQRIPAGE